MRLNVFGMVVAIALTTAHRRVRRAITIEKTGGGDQPIVVHLTNDLAPPSNVTVYAVTQDGIRRLIGDVPPNKDRALKVPSDVPRGSTFRLVAERTTALASRRVAADNCDERRADHRLDLCRRTRSGFRIRRTSGALLRSQRDARIHAHRA